LIINPILHYISGYILGNKLGHITLKVNNFAYNRRTDECMFGQSQQINGFNIIISKLAVHLPHKPLIFKVSGGSQSAQYEFGTNFPTKNQLSTCDTFARKSWVHVRKVLQSNFYGVCKGETMLFAPGFIPMGIIFHQTVAKLGRTQFILHGPNW